MVGVVRTVRVYVPATWDDLAGLVATGALTPRGGVHAVTPAVRAADPDGDIDDWEFHAFSDAAQGSLALLADAGSGAVAPRRVVVSADIDESEVLTGPSSAAQVTGDVRWPAVAAVHVDGAEAEPAVRAVVAGESPGGLDDVALEWYSPGEVPHLLA